MDTKSLFAKNVFYTSSVKFHLFVNMLCVNNVKYLSIFLNVLNRKFVFPIKIASVSHFCLDIPAWSLGLHWHINKCVAMNVLICSIS
jgi:hypothetical protein